MGSPLKLQQKFGYRAIGVEDHDPPPKSEDQLSQDMHLDVRSAEGRGLK